ncbi:MAG: hypothetical protein A4E38_01029 [Methanoregulaceae archaeon PtaB.Bin108]|nr:MAG: hypothetical protein A4E38_01029 [Methanoregulaceae archaeon PtaB.Bin108]
MFEKGFINLLEQFRRFHGFDDIPDSTQRESELLIFLIRICCRVKDKRNLLEQRIFLALPDEPKSVHFGHQDIRDNTIDPAGAEFL